MIPYIRSYHLNAFIKIFSNSNGTRRQLLEQIPCTTGNLSLLPPNKKISLRDLLIGCITSFFLLHLDPLSRSLSTKNFLNVVLVIYSNNMKVIIAINPK